MSEQHDSRSKRTAEFTELELSILILGSILMGAGAVLLLQWLSAGGVIG